MLNQFMKERNHLIVTFVITAVLKRVSKRNHLIVTFVITAVLKRVMKKHVESVHKEKKPFNCDISRLEEQ